MCAIELSEDLRTSAGKPLELFAASQVPWAELITTAKFGNTYVTDGPFLLRSASGALLMIWASFKGGSLCTGLVHLRVRERHLSLDSQPPPLHEVDGCYGMIFKTFEGDLILTLHSPNDCPNERAQFVPITLDGNSVTSSK